MQLTLLSDARLYYEIRGDGEPVVFISGLGATCRAWDSVVPHLGPGFCCITFDNRGVGKSTAERPAQSLEHYAADLVGLLDHLQLESVCVVGVSFGGMVAQCFAMQHASRVRRLALISTTHRVTPYLRESGQLIGHAVRVMPRRQFERLFATFGQGPRAVGIDAALSEAASRPTVPCREIVRQLRCAMSATPDPDAYRITAPTLVIAGEHDMLIPSCNTRDMADTIPDSRFVLVRDCGHDLISTCPPQFVTALKTFLKTGDVVASTSDRTMPAA